MKDVESFSKIYTLVQQDKQEDEEGATVYFARIFSYQAGYLLVMPAFLSPELCFVCLKDSIGQHCVLLSVFPNRVEEAGVYNACKSIILL